MCGIAGIIYGKPTDAATLKDRANRMVAALASRGPDDSGYWIDASSGCAIGHTRLSIIDLSELGHQPMVSADGRWVISFNGEIYNYADLQDELADAGVTLRGGSDTEAVLEYVAQFGLSDSLARINGMFGIALWDTHRQRLFLVRDRLGIKPLFYGKVDGAWVFGSELKAVLAIPERPSEIDKEALGHFLRHGYIGDDTCVFEDMSKVVPGTCVVLDAGGGDPEVFEFWSLKNTIEAASTFDGGLSTDQALEILDETLGNAVRRRLVADVPVGAFLSGGIDSSLIVALMRRHSDLPVRTFTIGFREQHYDESKIAASVSAALGTVHTCLTATPDDALRLVEELPVIYDEPFADASAIPTILVSRLAVQHVKVALSGDGGDELFAGYNRYRRAEHLWRRIRKIPSPAAGLARLAAGIVPGSWSLENRFRRAAAMIAARNSREFYRSAVSVSNSIASIVPGYTGTAGRFAEAGSIAGIDTFRDEMMYTDTINYLSGDILTKVDRATMSCGLEGRVPLLDHEVVECAWLLRHKLRDPSKEPKHALRSLLFNHVDSTLFARPKSGFAIPVVEWLRGPLRAWAEALMLGQAHPVIDSRQIRRAWQEFIRGKDNEARLIWNILMFLAWDRQWRA